ncbi:MAG: hypothetical protein J1F22_00075 [Lachnospiraceae bacterium]|nr:hypothetical protein [Lachnospiraceae bacterium]
MEKRMKNLLVLYKDLTEQTLPASEAAAHKEKLLVQIQFMQHERLIHLIVTVLFALLTVITLFASLFLLQPLLLVLFLLFLVLLIPYIRHYYILENGVQKLYEYHDKLEALSEKK